MSEPEVPAGAVPEEPEPAERMHVVLDADGEAWWAPED